MNKELVEFELADGSTVLFETDPVQVERGGASLEDEPVGIFERGSLVHKATEQFDAVVNRIAPAAQVVMNALRKIEAPQEIELEFGLKITGTSSVVFAGVGGEVNFNVKLKWTRQDGK